MEAVNNDLKARAVTAGQCPLEWGGSLVNLLNLSMFLVIYVVCTPLTFVGEVA